MRSRSVVIFCLALAAVSVSAQVHRCKDGTGKLIFSDRPCAVDQTGELVEQRKSNRAIYEERVRAYEAETRKQEQYAREQERNLNKRRAYVAPPPVGQQQAQESWQARKDRENAQTSASSITNNQGRWDAKAEAERAAQRREELRRREAAQKQFMLTCTAGMCTDEWGATYSGSGAFLTRSDGRSCSVMGNTAHCQ